MIYTKGYNLQVKKLLSKISPKSKKKLLKEKKINFTAMYFMKRVGKWNYWEETTLEDALTKKYTSVYPFANAIAFLVVRK